MRHFCKSCPRSRYDKRTHGEQHDQQQEPRLSRMQIAERRRPRRCRFIRLPSLQTVPESSRKSSNVLGCLRYVNSSKHYRVATLYVLLYKNTVEERPHPTFKAQILLIALINLIQCLHV